MDYVLALFAMASHVAMGCKMIGSLDKWLVTIYYAWFTLLCIVHQLRPDRRRCLHHIGGRFDTVRFDTVIEE